MSEPVIAKRHLAVVDTEILIQQYNLAISSFAGRFSNTAPRQVRINYIVDLLSARADNNDPVALAWLNEET